MSIVDHYAQHLKIARKVGERNAQNRAYRHEQQVVLKRMLLVCSELPVYPDLQNLCLSYAAQTPVVADASVNELMNERPSTAQDVSLGKKLSSEHTVDTERTHTVDTERTHWTTSMMWSYRIPWRQCDIDAWKRVLRYTINQMPNTVSVLRRLLSIAFDMLRCNEKECHWQFPMMLKECLVMPAVTSIRYEWIPYLLAVEPIELWMVHHLPSQCVQSQDDKSLNIILEAMRPHLTLPAFDGSACKRDWLESKFGDKWRIAWEEYHTCLEQAAERNAAECMRILLSFFKTVPNPGNAQDRQTHLCSLRTFALAALSDADDIFRQLHDSDFRVEKSDLPPSLLAQLIILGHYRSLAVLRKLYALTCSDFPNGMIFLSCCVGLYMEANQTPAAIQPTSNHTKTILLLHDEFHMEQEQFARLLTSNWPYRTLLLQYGDEDTLPTMLRCYGWQHVLSEDLRSSRWNVPQMTSLRRISVLSFLSKEAPQGAIYIPEFKWCMDASLQSVCLSDDMDEVRALLQCKNIGHYVRDSNLFKMMAITGHDKVLTEFKRCGIADANHARQDNNIALDLAIKLGNLDVVRVLRMDYGLNKTDILRDINLTMCFAYLRPNVLAAMVEELRCFDPSGELDWWLYQALSRDHLYSRYMNKTRPSLWALWERLYANTTSPPSSWFSWCLIS